MINQPIHVILFRYYRRAAATAGILIGLTILIQTWSLTNASAVQSSNQPIIGPGIPQSGSNSPQSALSNLKAGSVLFFPSYVSSISDPSQVNTIVTLTNTNPRDGVTVRLAWIHDCEVKNTFVTLAGNQTQTVLASLENPGKTGYIMAMAVNPNGIPTQFNWLIGSASLRNEQGNTATYNAVSVARRAGGAAPSSTSAVVPLVFNDQQYDRLPEQVALDHLQNQDPAKSVASGDTVKTMITLISPLSDLTGGVAEPIRLTSILYDKSGRPYPQATNGTCAINRTASELWTDPALADIVSPERPGWARFAAETGTRALPLLGLSLSTVAMPGTANIRHMQVMRRLDTFTISVPVIKPDNAAPEVPTSGQLTPEGKSLGAGEMKPGSILIYPRFTSGDQGASQLFLTNTHPTAKARIRIFFNGTLGNGAVAETIISLFPNETTRIDPQLFMPNQRGWAMAMAIDLRALPLNFNNLIGSSLVTEQSGAKNGYAALAVSRNASGSVPRNSDVETSDVIFNDLEYDRLPAALAYIDRRTLNVVQKNLPNGRNSVVGKYYDQTKTTTNRSGNQAVTHVGFAVPMSSLRKGGIGTLAFSYTIGGYLEESSTGPTNSALELIPGLGVRNFTEKKTSKSEFYTVAYGRTNGAGNFAYGLGLTVVNQLMQLKQTGLLVDSGKSDGRVAHFLPERADKWNRPRPARWRHVFAGKQSGSIGLGIGSNADSA
ncbi:MAG: hypothetical protein EBZ36_09435 [Acidobacteria bacterium]|nr:hypothetical protein [Acidobacteriota bacterium]